MTKATISAKGQVSIPKAIRERLKLTPGTQVALDVQGAQVVMRRLVSGLPDWRSMRGIFRGGVNLQEELAKEREDELARDDARLQTYETPQSQEHSLRVFYDFRRMNHTASKCV